MAWTARYGHEMIYLQLLEGLRPGQLFSGLFTNKEGAGFHAIQT